jgi:hypothetical protein
MHMWHHVTNHLIISNDKDSNSENRIKLRVRDIVGFYHRLPIIWSLLLPGEFAWIVLVFDCCMWVLDYYVRILGCCIVSVSSLVQSDWVSHKRNR